jgi:hypothetical protein
VSCEEEDAFSSVEACQHAGARRIHACHTRRRMHSVQLKRVSTSERGGYMYVI